MRALSEFRNAHAGQDIYVLASGASMDHVHEAFFDGRVTVGVNQVFRRFARITYLVRKELDGLEAALQSSDDATVHFVSRGEAGGPNSANLQALQGRRYASYRQRVVVFDHQKRGFASRNWALEFPHDGLIVSHSTITSAMHLAAYMGAKHIILAGHDCGTLDGSLNFRGYHSSSSRAIAWARHGEADQRSSERRYAHWLTNNSTLGIERTTLRLKALLWSKYQAYVYSLNPFVNFGLEGHRYRGPRR